MDINWRKIFDWSVSSVVGPCPLITAGKIIGYRVDVKYRYHGMRYETFPVERDGISGDDVQSALSQAQKFANKMYAKRQNDDRSR